MSVLKAVVVDDERLARQRLARLLRAAPDVEVVATCRSARQACDVLAGGSVDVIFTDVQMPRASGFDLLRLAPPTAEGTASPLVVFVTAFEHYAVRAFEVSACDYLLKPVTAVRVQVAVQRARDRRGPAGVPEAGAAKAQAETASDGAITNAVLVRTDTCVLRVPIETIDWIEAAGNYVTLHAGGSSHLLRETLAAFEARLPAGRFARVHRTAIVNIDRIVAFEPTPSGDFDVALRQGRRVRMSRTYRDRIRDLFGRPI